MQHLCINLVYNFFCQQIYCTANHQGCQLSVGVCGLPGFVADLVALLVTVGCCCIAVPCGEIEPAKTLCFAEQG